MNSKLLYYILKGTRMWHFCLIKKQRTKPRKPLPLTQCEVLDNCMQHLLMADLMAKAVKPLCVPGNL